jgi:hypothetical protein
MARVLRVLKLQLPGPDILFSINDLAARNPKHLEKLPNGSILFAK